jgi:Protein of unknown function (DUF2783)
MALITTPHLDAADAFYESLIDAHRDFSAVQSHELNAKLVLLLANHIGDATVLRAALAAARANMLQGGDAAASKDHQP